MSYQSRIPKITAQMLPRVAAATAAGAELIAQRAKARAPDAPPYGEGLREAIHVEQSGPTTYAVVAGDRDAFYGHMVEHGTSHSAPRPFLMPAVEESRAEIMASIAAALKSL